MEQTFTKEEQKATLKILDFLINVDDFVHIQEVDYLTEIIEHYNFENGLLLNVNEYDLTESFQLVEQMSSEKRKLFVNIAQGQAQADNKVVKEEKDFLQYLKNKIKLKTA